ncbi:BTB/POZ protein [Rhizophagus irregularis DAOM 181602=DAOM 197198]|nr:BTB/POZ protein [Rhizophagus irregularis DAOM 181602=DAOM 197198]
MAGNKFLPKLSQNLLEILDDDEYYDITIEVGNDPNIILRYIYGGKLTLEEYDDISDIFKILVTANELSLQELNNYLQSFLVENNASWIEQNFNLVYQTSFKNDSFLELQSNSIENHILSRVKNENKAIWNGEWRSYSFGPSFGNSDLILYGNDFYDMSHCRKHSYEKEIRETEEVFSVEEIEVYHIIKN